MKRLIDAAKYALLGGGSGIYGAARAKMIERALRALRAKEAAQSGSDVDVTNYHEALAELHVLCTPERIVRLAAGDYLPPQRPLRGVGRWVARVHDDVRELARRLSSDFVELHDRLDRQRQVIRDAHGAILACKVVPFSLDIGDAIRELARQRDVLTLERDELIAERGRLHEERARLHDQLDHLVMSCERLARERDRLNGMNGASEADLRNMRKARDELLAERDRERQVDLIAERARARDEGREEILDRVAEVIHGSEAPIGKLVELVGRERLNRDHQPLADLGSESGA